MPRIKKLAKVILFIALVFSVLGYRAVSAQLNSEIEEKVIVTKKRDVSGDGKKERILIVGVPYEPKSAFLKEIYLIVEIRKGKKLKVPLDAGFEPKLHFADFNRDGVDDVYVTIPTGSSGGLINSYAYSFFGGKGKDLTVPPFVPITGQFMDQFKIVMSVPFLQPLVMDVSDRKKDYIRIGLYQKNGKLNEPTEVMVDPYSLLDIAEFPDKRKGLRGVQRVSGAYHADSLADVYSKWEYQDGNWQLLQAKTKTIAKKTEPTN
ncbi:hypothetical protein [Peribacillus glennii]|uniref:VCBS repeat-containing protein n=1 Tax=Peribacillus glennii TaxID=2303991 RepID=A0A372L7C2_9BACI|nr:hypothetical protein [Peribacillus glennii]RFU60571.1 hypothetical protein D0466_21375 [Peribacillus glennii]